MPDLEFERLAGQEGFEIIAGVDEAGRGPLAGPVVAAAVILDPERVPEGVDDSKRLGRESREELCRQIMRTSRVAFALATVEEIEELNILHAAHLAMRRSLESLKPRPDLAIIDGNLLPKGLFCEARALVKGDAKSLSVAAASIVAKVQRDRIMGELARGHPEYGWERNAGYPTPSHKRALMEHGATPHHRRGYEPVREALGMRRPDS